MKEIHLLPQDIHQHTLLNNLFIDTYLPEANGDYVKVYILLLRMILGGQLTFTTTSLAKKLYLIESDVIRALNYWQDLQLIDIVLEADEIQQIGLNTPTLPSSPSKKTAQIYTRPTYTMEEMALITEQSDFKQLLYITERYLGKQLTQIDVNTLLGFVDWLDLPVDVVEYLIEFCVSNDHRHMNYIEKIAIDWSDEGIKSIQQAKAKTAKSSRYYKILTTYGINNRIPTTKEIAFMKRWLETWHFSLDMIQEACQRTLTSTHTISFPYTDSILKNWHNKKAYTLKDLQSLDASHEATKKTAPKKLRPSKPNNRFHNHDQRSYDYTALESKMSELIRAKVK